MRTWVNSNIRRAAALSKIPPPPQLNLKLSSSKSNLSEFLRFRKWEMPVEKEELIFVSQLLTYPLSLSRLLEQCDRGKATRILVLGARAEAILPPKLWYEAILAGPRPPRPLHLHFIGPSVIENPPIENRVMQLRWTRGFYHDIGMPCHSDIDAIVFFNPGLGSPQHRESWKKTLQDLYQQQQQMTKPVLITSLSAADAALDAQILCEMGLGDAQFELNPFRSLYNDIESCAQSDEYANHYISVI